MIYEYLLTAKETIKIINVNPEAFKLIENNIRFIKLGRAKLYHLYDIESFINGNKLLLNCINDFAQKTTNNDKIYLNISNNQRLKSLDEQLYKLGLDIDDNLNIYSLYSIGKISYYLEYKETYQNICKAWLFRNRLNRFITFHINRFIIKPSKLGVFIADFFRWSNKLLRRYKIEPCYLWTIENGETKGYHLHLIIHIPTGEIYKKWKRCLFAKYGNYRNFFGCEEIKNPKSLIGVLEYIHKGIDIFSADKLKETLGLAIELYYQGLVVGRRSGLSTLLKNTKLPIDFGLNLSKVQ